MTSIPEKQEGGFGFPAAEAKKHREEQDAREKWERDVERLAAGLLIQHTAAELAVIAAQHIIYKEAIEALNLKLKEANTALQTENAMKLNIADLNAYVTRIAVMVKNGHVSYLASKRAKKSHEKRPQTAAKQEVKKYWDNWQRRPCTYSGDAEFARDMVEKFDGVLKSTPVIERWSRKWRKSAPC